MSLNIIGLIGEIFTPAIQLIDNVHTSDEERLNAKARLLELHIKAAAQAQEYEKRLLDAQTKIITAEAQGDSTIQRVWRPITMLVFLGLVVCDSFGLLATPLAPEMWTLLQLGLSGYVVGRSGEKIVKEFKNGRGK